ncbi:MAG: aminotransferase class I/II-fold pyridoxal phosphate-dependent enzyme [Bacillota bacterium]|jgi:aminotransferase|nr:aminotransferase class I/II-fold pyridoxal phosphate-dependent enzyme [Bacillota bacterium]HOB91758.1 aminotransferase class I/II-fold pyridoxal phosphate-dependent enzyme [Bacillota bacterium]HPZ55218.1 aminotransferase class I/II-fold pyridoxal phosphate-dependent enzyme [Bacillota bacterium]HQD18633.1 aminotransferase class I/II-fold pyridoxal phosphate-dependent enzyme [Bacillota bacterium]
MKFEGTKYLSQTVASLPPSGIRKFFDVASQMEGVISLGVGEPDFVTPWHIIESSYYSVSRGHTSYTSNLGLLELREAISDRIYQKCGLEYNPVDEVLVTTGVSEALDLAVRALVSPGDEVIIIEPCYVSYKACVHLAGGVPVVVDTYVENAFRPDPADIERRITDKTKAIVLSYPNNPTGAVVDRATLVKIAEIAKSHDLIVISDEIYDELTYDGTHTCIASLPGMRERTVLLNGFSKAYAMTGWRIGYVAGNRDIVGAMMRIHQYTMLCAPVMGQKAAIEALTRGEAEMKRMVSEYNRRRRYIVKQLNSIGLTCFEPKGAFYAFPSIRSTGLSSEEFCNRLLMEEQVAVVPGSAFGAAGEGYVRCSYAASLEEIEEAVNRMQRFVSRHAG